MEISQEDIGKILSIFDKDADELIFVLRAHLEIESILENIIKSKFPEHKYVLGKRVQFFDKLRLVKAMGILPKGVYPSVMALATLRDKFVHKKNYQIKIEDIDPIGTLLKERYEKIKKEHSMKTKIRGTEKTKNMILILTISNILGYMHRLQKDHVRISSDNTG